MSPERAFESARHHEDDHERERRGPKSGLLQRRMAPQPSLVLAPTSRPYAEGAYTAAEAVQMFASAVSAGVHSPAEVQRAAAHGMSGTGAALPHLGAIQRAFGKHDVSGVRAHVGGVAAEGSAAMGARAYASGGAVAFAQSPDLHLAAHEAAHVVQQRGGVQLSGGVGAAGDPYERHADAVADLVVRGESAEALLDRYAGNGSATSAAVQRDEHDHPTPRAPASVVETFVTRFNREFAAQLHVFAHVVAGPETSDEHARSGDDLAQADLERLFTPRQRAALNQFCLDHVIPLRLFDGDDVGGATAQERILLAGHILSVGHYSVGHIEEQRVHARMCGHWAQLVIHYAGAGSGMGRGAIDEFGFDGGLDLSVSGAEGATEGETHDVSGRIGTRASTDLAVRFAQTGIPREEYAAIVPGDWLYLYNSNGVAGGNHSVIFSRWSGPESVYESPYGRVTYRRAVTMSQIGPSVGGREESRALGDHMVAMTSGPDAGLNITPVTLRIHVSEDARPLRTAAELVAMLGHGATAEANHRYAERRAHGEIDWTRLATFIQERNAALIAQLQSRMTPAQLAAFTGANTATGDDGQIDTLVRLNERLAVLVTNAGELAAGMERAHETGVDEHHDEIVESQRADRERLDGELAAAHERLTAAQAVDAEIGSADRSDYERAHAEVLRLRGDMSAARERSARRRIQAELQHAIAAQTAAWAALQHASRDLRRAHNHAARDIRQAQDAIDRVLRDLGRLDATAGYHTAAGGADRDEFQGAASETRVTGLLEHLDVAPPWASLRVGGAAAPTP